jgi:rsbT co-antagonist protein RsbR
MKKLIKRIKLFKFSKRRHKSMSEEEFARELDRTKLELKEVREMMKIKEKMLVRQVEDAKALSRELGANLEALEVSTKLLKQQQETIRSLSTPVIEIWDNILALPLIGTIDSLRAKQLTENLLTQIVKSQAAIVIIDITGVAIVDTQVANRLLKAVEMSKLLGTECFLVGVRPEVAQVLVQLGVDLSRIRSYVNLRAGLKASFDELRLKVTKD